MDIKNFITLGDILNISCADVGMEFECVVDNIEDRMLVVHGESYRNLPSISVGTIVRIKGGKTTMRGACAPPLQTKCKLPTNLRRQSSEV